MAFKRERRGEGCYLHIYVRLYGVRAHCKYRWGRGRNVSRSVREMGATDSWRGRAQAYSVSSDK
jgi:hypothetical protein